MKKLSTSQLIEICTATPEQEAAAIQLMGKTFDCDAAWLSRKDFYKAEVVTVDAVPRFTIFFHVNDQRVLFVNAAAQLSRGFSDFSALVSGMIAIAKKHGCSAVEGVTIRAGVLKKLLAAGFEPIGVNVSLKL